MSSELTTKPACKFILHSGTRKNQECGCPIVRNSRYCSRHFRKMNILSTNSLPADIILYLAGFLDMISLYQFSQSTNYTRHVFNNSYSEKIWNNAIKQITDTDYKNVPANTSPQRSLQLLANRGCEECGKSRIRKVYWPFAKRLCKSCLESLTISDYRLTREYNIPPEFWPTNHQNVQLWSKYYGSYNLKFYLISEVETRFGKTLKQIKDEKNAEIMRRYKLKNDLTTWAQKEYSNKSLISKCKSYSEILPRIMDGEIPSLEQILTKDFTSKLSEEYKKLKDEVRESSRQTRQKIKLYQEFMARLKDCKNYEDFSNLNRDVRNSGLPFRKIYAIEAEIWNRSKNIKGQ